MKNFIVFEGICCSGKTTTCQLLKEKIENLGYNVVYNHGAMTYTESGKYFKKIIEEKDKPISVSYFLTDLIINTQNVIKPLLQKENTIVIQDRYYNAITTYINAYGKYVNKDYNIYDIQNELVKNGIFEKPSLEIFCIPPFEVVQNRMKESKQSSIHDFYRLNPDFFKGVYDELKTKALETDKNIIIDTSSEVLAQKGVEDILKRLQGE